VGANRLAIFKKNGHLDASILVAFERVEALPGLRQFA
jgi:hypothetical protein